MEIFTSPSSAQQTIDWLPSNPHIFGMILLRTSFKMVGQSVINLQVPLLPSFKEHLSPVGDLCAIKNNYGYHSRLTYFRIGQHNNKL